MKILISFMITLISVILIYTMIPIDTSNLEEISLSEGETTYLSTIELKSEFNIGAKKIITSNKLGDEMVSGQDVPYTSPSSHLVDQIYERDWSHNQNLFFGPKPSVQLQSTLFKDTNNKYTLLVKYNVNIETSLDFYLSMDIKNINYVEVLDVAYVNHKGHDYFMRNMLSKSEDKYLINSENKNTQIKHLEGYLLFELLHFSSSVIEINTNIFEPIVIANAHIGFNAFNPDNGTQFIPSTSKILYKEN